MHETNTMHHVIGKPTFGLLYNTENLNTYYLSGRIVNHNIILLFPI